MTIDFGRYRWFSKHIAYRSDYCLTCESPQIANQYRTFDFIHLYHIPVVPLGFWRHWHCAACDNDPHLRQRTARWVKILAAVVFGLLAVVYWLLYRIHREESSVITAILFTVMVPIFLVLAIRHRPGPMLEEQLRTIPPLDDEHCYYCGGELWGMPRQCEDCHLYQLENERIGR